jgi:ATP-dependent helicase/nuclease subunit B
MIIHFGLDLDGMEPERPATAVGYAVLGPARLLDVLELQLGLPRTAARPGEALLAYQACLAELDDASRFYHRSFAVDPLGTARTLLAWRADWYAAGWRGAFGGSVAGRLADLADVERLARDRVPSSPGQRLARVAAALEQGAKTQIERIVLRDEPAGLPAAWRRVIGHFDHVTAAGVDPEPAARPSTDLGRLQRALAGADGSLRASPDKIHLDGDDSVVVVRGVSRDSSAQAVGECLLRAGTEEAVVIAERDGIIVDNALERVGLPRAGFAHYSRFRAVTQALKLALGLVWDPVSPHLLLQFLLHPVGPLPSHVRAALADAVAAEPGVGGHAWREAVRRIGEAAARRERDAGPAARSAGASGAETLRDEIRYWLECERYAPATGAPIAVLIERVERVTTWLAGRLHGAARSVDADLYAAANAQGEALIAALSSFAERGARSVARIALEQLVDEVASRGTDPAIFAQANHVAATTAPATVTSAWRTVIWWDMSAPPPPPPDPWSETELTELRAEGVALLPAAERIRVRNRAWRRPFMNAREQLILVVHDREQGRHPLFSRLTALTDGYTEIRVEDVLLDGADGGVIDALRVATDPLPPLPLPAPRRWWTLPSDCRLAPRAKESYTSLEKLIYHPHEWVLGYPARLTRGRAANLSDGPLLFGNLAHRLLQMYFAAPDWAARDAGAVERWLADTLGRLIETEGAVLTEPGMGVTREFVAATLESALKQLLRHFERGGIEHVAAEQWHEVPLTEFVLHGDKCPVALCGAIDLVLTDRRGRETVLDVKWSGEGRRGAELEGNRALQLAAYAFMRKSATRSARWPAQAYFIVKTGNILAHDTVVFPDAVPFAPPSGDGAAELWMRAEAALRWRWRQLVDGVIEVNAEGTEPDAGSEPPAGALDTQVPPDPFDEFARLAGWEPGA